MAPRIVIIGGGSYQWVPKLIVDIVNTPSLADADIVLEDINPDPLEPMAALVRHIAGLKGVDLTVSTTTDQRAALEGADYVVVTISTGGFTSMHHDLEVPERHGIKQSVGDSVGPGGVMRALRNIPVLVGIARDMEDICPDAWMLNITNPMTTLCRAVTRETEIKTVGLCHEVAGVRWMLSNVLGADFRAIDYDIVGVNHLPLITALRVDGEDAFPQLRELLADPKLLDEPISLPPGLDPEIMKLASEVTKRSVLDSHQVKLALFERFGVLPGAGDRHLVEFFPGFLTEESEWGKRWGVALTTIADRERDAGGHIAAFEEAGRSTEVSNMPSGEIVAPMIDSFLRDRPHAFPVNLPNEGQAPGLPGDVVVEAMCVADGQGLHGRDTTPAPPLLTEWLRRIASAQEATVEAAISGSREKAVEAMMLDPLAGRIDYDHVEQMTHEMLAATAQWLPQFRVKSLTFDALTVQVFDDLPSLAHAAAVDAGDALRAAIDHRGEANVMFATGNSQLAFLAELVQLPGIAWDHVRAFHMDEYVGIAPSHPASFQRYMRERVAAQLPVKEFNYLNGDTGDGPAEAHRYQELLRAHPLDLCCCGVGENGHLAFNDPPVADFDDSQLVKEVALELASRRQQVGEGHFATIDDVPTHTITVTIPGVLGTGRVLAIVPEARKARPVHDALYGPITTECPASILRRQANATLYLDSESAGELTT